MGVFSAKQGPNMDAKRNTFDLSFSNNLTMQFGKIYPVFVKPCDPGDSFNIKASFGLNFLPTVYPVQTPMKAYLHFFYCRNRTVWDDFMNFYTMKDRAGQNLGSSEIIPPFLDFNFQTAEPSSLADYMGIPILEGSDYKESFVADPVTTVSPTTLSSSSWAFPASYVRVPFSPDERFIIMNTFPSSAGLTTEVVPSSEYLFPIFKYTPAGGFPFIGKTGNEIAASIVNSSISRPSTFSCGVNLRQSGSTIQKLYDIGITQEFVNTVNKEIQTALSNTSTLKIRLIIPAYDKNNNLIGTFDFYSMTSPLSAVLELDTNRKEVSLMFSGTSLLRFTVLQSSAGPLAALGTPVLPIQSEVPNFRLLFARLAVAGLNPNPNAWRISPAAFSLGDLAGPLALKFNYFTTLDTPSTNTPYYNSKTNPDGLRISSLPFRHYLAIYNYFYRDNRNNPLRDSSGNPVYNEVLLDTSGGPEVTGYGWKYHNWEQDFLTTCVPEPQLGIAPLVGISSLGEATFRNEDGSTTKVQLTYSDDGNTVTGWQATDGIDAPVAQSLIQMSSQGISISDFRNVNAFQTWLEVQMRKTLRFGDSIQGHFNVNPRYDDYLYPEFIGGVTQDVDTYQVNQTVPTSDAPLGSYAGQAICKGRIPRSISKFCDEPGYIIGLLSLVPRPVYSQILPKHYLRHETLDYHFPEFNNISYQPVTYREVCPVLAYNENPDLLDKVFGYQRPWYDLISSLDEVHGQFLTTLNGFIMSRRFIGAPQLSDRFLTIHPEDLNDIFATQMTDSNDVVLGQLYFDVKKKSTISKFGIPSLQV
uniref:Major capsid protein n=1 Tax=Dulem virus 250 TaxID=3145727 RepID=A0AAU8AWL3_9VIRU